MASNDERWMAALGDAAVAFRTAGELPTGTHYPGSWIQAQRAAWRGKKSWLTEERLSLLDANLPGWWESPRPLDQRAWDQSAVLLVDHVRTTGALPRQNAADNEERRLARWLTTQRVASHAGELSAERKSWLDDRLPGWVGAGPRPAAWQAVVRELGAWVDAAGRWPSTRAEDATERRLALWVKNRREDARCGRLSDDRRKELDRLAPGWDARR